LSKGRGLAQSRSRRCKEGQTDGSPKVLMRIQGAKGSRVYFPKSQSEIFVVHLDPRILDPLDPYLHRSLVRNYHPEEKDNGR
jgi:hypothetical protein